MQSVKSGFGVFSLGGHNLGDLQEGAEAGALRFRDWHRYRGQDQPRGKGYRPYRNRAMVYCLIETGMRWVAARNLNLRDVNFRHKTVPVEEKGGLRQKYQDYARWPRGHPGLPGAGTAEGS
jgi:integrase